MFLSFLPIHMTIIACIVVQRYTTPFDSWCSITFLWICCHSNPVHSCKSSYSPYLNIPSTSDIDPTHTIVHLCSAASTHILRLTINPIPSRYQVQALSHVRVFHCDSIPPGTILTLPSLVSITTTIATVHKFAQKYHGIIYDAIAQVLSTRVRIDDKLSVWQSIISSMHVQEKSLETAPGWSASSLALQSIFWSSYRPIAWAAISCSDRLLLVIFNIGQQLVVW